MSLMRSIQAFPRILAAALLVAPVLAGCLGPADASPPSSSLSPIPFEAVYRLDDERPIYLNMTGPATVMDHDLTLRDAYLLMVETPWGPEPLRRVVFAVDGDWKVGRKAWICNPHLFEPMDAPCINLSLSWRERGYPAPFGLALPAQVQDGALRFVAQSRMQEVPASMARSGDGFAVDLHGSYRVPMPTFHTAPSNRTLEYGPDGVLPLTLWWREGGQDVPAALASHRLGAGPPVDAWPPALYDGVGDAAHLLFPGSDRAAPLGPPSFPPDELLAGLRGASPAADDALREGGCVLEMVVAFHYHRYNTHMVTLGLDHLDRGHSFKVVIAGPGGATDYGVMRNERADVVSYSVYREEPVEDRSCAARDGRAGATVPWHEFVAEVASLPISHAGDPGFTSRRDWTPPRDYMPDYGPDYYTMRLVPQGATGNSHQPYGAQFHAGPGWLDLMALHPDDVARLDRGERQEWPAAPPQQPLVPWPPLLDHAP